MSSGLASGSAPRRDGRGQREMRGKELRSSELNQFDGSAWYAQGGTAVVAAVNGPVAARQEDYKKCDVRVYVNRARRIPNAGGAERLIVSELREEQRRADLELSRMLTNCVEAVVLLDRFPRLVLEVHLTILADDGSLYAVAANALMCALLDAGLPCRTTMAAVTIAACAESSASPFVLLLDPTKTEEETDEVGCCATGTFVVSNPKCGGGVLASRVGTRTCSMAQRRFTGKELENMIALAERAATTLFEFFRNCSVPLE